MSEKFALLYIYKKKNFNVPYTTFLNLLLINIKKEIVKWKKYINITYLNDKSTHDKNVFSTIQFSEIEIFRLLKKIT